MKNIAAGNHKVSQLAGVLELPSNALSPYLKTLMELDLVKKRIPVTEKQPEKSRKGLYFINDHFIEFWFRFVYAYKGELELDNVEYVLGKKRKALLKIMSALFMKIFVEIYFQCLVEKVKLTLYLVKLVLIGAQTLKLMLWHSMKKEKKFY